MEHGMTEQAERMPISLAVRLAAVALLAATIAGCAGVRTPRAYEQWTALIDEVRAFEQQIGFEPTDNFLDLSKEQAGFPICGYASRLYLPYSYEDPAIQWPESVTSRECRAAAEGTDVFFTTVEAVGEIGTPVTASMVGGKLDRVLYLVIHEDCHDQFELPYGIEEALCNLIAYKAMAVFTEQKFGADSREHKAIRGYADQQSELTRATKAVYEQLAAHYARYQREEISRDALMLERATVLRSARRPLGWKRGELNNVGLAYDMTYSRHYPYLEGVFDALGRDLERMVAFFKRVDELKPSREEVVNRHGLDVDDGVEFIRAYEGEIVKTIENALAQARRR